MFSVALSVALVGQASRPAQVLVFVLRETKSRTDREVCPTRPPGVTRRIALRPDQIGTRCPDFPPSRSTAASSRCGTATVRPTRQCLFYLTPKKGKTGYVCRGTHFPAGLRVRPSSSNQFTTTWMRACWPGATRIITKFCPSRETVKLGMVVPAPYAKAPSNKA